MGIPRGVRLRAPAKINLGLEVMGRRADGYHRLRTVLQAVDLADSVVVAPAQALSLTVESTEALPVEGNLVLTAARLLQAEAAVAVGARITLRKRIPVSAGLGGGSSDAAATLRCLCRLWELDRSAEWLEGLAAELGSDVPFFVRGGTALGEGRGERLTALPTPPGQSAVLLAPSARTEDGKTGRLYGLLNGRHFSDGGRVEGLVRRLWAGQGVHDGLCNTLEEVAPAAHPTFAAAVDTLRSAGFARPLMAGAGPTIFALAPSARGARHARDRLIAQGHRAYATRFLARWGLDGPV